MKKYMVLLTVLVIGVLALSACSGGGSQSTPMSTEGVPNTGGFATDTFPTDVFSSTALPTTGGLSTSEATQAAPTTSVSTEASTATSQVMTTSTPQATGQANIPSTGGSLVELSAMMNFRVQDSNGNELGRVTDYVVNVCEAHIAYIVVNTNSTGSGAGNNVVLIPYQAATSLNGTLGAGVLSNNGASTGGNVSGTSVSGTAVSGDNSTQSGGVTSGGSNVNQSGDVIVVNIGGADLASFPAISLQSLDMNNVAWEADVTNFWAPYMKLGLTTACSVPASGGTAMPTDLAPVGTAVAPDTTSTSVSGTAVANPTRTSDRVTVNKVALASAVLNADLTEGNGRSFGKIRDAVVIRNTGGILYYIVQAVAGNQQGIGNNGNTGTVVPDNSTVGTAQPAGTQSSLNSGSNNAAGLIALPPGAVNVRHDGGTTVFYLLVPTNVALNSPAYTGDFNNFNTVDSQWFSYWSQYLPMTQSQLP